ncbi:hypothetical protein [Altericista sp. CCNU0014]|uniref:hypothetical protein n=1 Tax=Altericista sp. CCNU0014 TaxID=3082949 RepID=UPI0038511066
MPPNYWLQFVEVHHLIGKSVCLDEDTDLSTLGADMQFLTVEQSIDELTNFWPGIGVAKDGYIPIAWCSTGSGDYYYININDGPNGPLYRVLHDSVGPEGYNAMDAVAKVLDHYEDLLPSVEP